MQEDYRRIQRLGGIFTKLLTTPHILTETSNLLRSEMHGEDLKACSRSFAMHMQRLYELPVDSARSAQRPEFAFLGLTDCVIADVCQFCFVLSSDARMVVKLNESGLDAVNFNHFRYDLQQLL